MTDEEIIMNEAEEILPEPAPEPVPDPVPAPAPEEPAAPVEVVTVEDLLDRLTGVGQEETEEKLPQEEEPDFSELEEPAAAEPMEVIGMETILSPLEALQQTADHPALTTPFEDYTVTEGLLLLLLLSVFVAACMKMLKGGFAWLR